MLRWIVDAMVFLGAGLMVYNIYGFVCFTREIRTHKGFEEHYGVLYVPIGLLVMFLLGYLAVGLFGNPDLIVAGILFFGSVFVFIMYRLLKRITRRIIEGERWQSKMLAAQEANRAKTDFLSDVSHEMRTPLNIILGLNGMAMRSPELQPATRQQLEKVELSARHLLGMINNILDLNRIESGELSLKNEEFNLAEAIAQTDVIVQTMCEGKGLLYRGPDPAAARGRYLGDALQLKHVLLSILDNAVKYTTAPGTVRFSVETVDETADTRRFRFTVSDTGVGMEPEFLSRLFEDIQREKDDNSRFGGTGISLTLTRHIVELMGGSLKAESEKGRGSVFTVEIPLTPLPEPEPLAPEACAEPLVLAGSRVLVAEDVQENAEIVMDLLEMEDVETDLAENGAIALEKFTASEPGYYDAILMDLRMPEMDGLEATRRIRASQHPDAKHIPIIALTANALESDIRQTAEAGMNAHLTKPSDADLLYDTLRQQIAAACGREIS